MKKIFLFSLLIVIGCKSFCQSAENQKTIFINDVRKKGLMPYDTITKGYLTGDVAIIWGRQLDFNKTDPKNERDTIDSYQICFYKPDLNNHLKKYRMGWTQKEVAYDRATYFWSSDTTVVITLIQNDPEIKRTITLVQFPHQPTWSAGILKDDELKKEEEEKK